MRIIYTLQARTSLQHSIDFLKYQGVPEEKIEQIFEDLISKIESLQKLENRNQIENYLTHLSKNYRRLITGHYKVIYYTENEFIYITDIFDSRQDPSKMKP